MLDFARLKAPAAHGEVLVVPEPKQLAAVARENRSRLDACGVLVGGVELRELRRKTRLRVVGDEQRLVIVAGHQPEFMHAGVWAKHVVAQRLARALEAAATNLVVDNDAPSSTDLVIPFVRGDSVDLRRIAGAPAPYGAPYESLPSLSADEVRRFTREVGEAMGGRYQQSMMPLYIEGLQRTPTPRDWVEQVLAGRHAVENALDIQVRDVRVSEAWWSPLFSEMVLNARRFAETYNAALGDYRRTHKIRGAAQPIPDLFIAADRLELPLWAFRETGPRLRVFLRPSDERLKLVAGEQSICDMPMSDFAAAEDLVAQVAQTTGWRIRPRALALTMWARLLLADIFIHGIGGAKYDRITDRIIKMYFAVEPPEMACVTATMRLNFAMECGLPSTDRAAEEVRRQKRAIRDMIWNPQLGGDRSPHLAALRKQRQELVTTSRNLRERTPREHQTRRDVFRQLRNINKQLLQDRAQDLEEARIELSQAEQAAAQAKVAASREYFFALLERAELERLLAALPGERDFRV